VFLTALAVILLIACSAFFSGSETALTGSSKARMHRLAKSGDKRAIAVEKLSEKSENTLGAILLGNNTVNILASALATSLFIGLFGETGVIYATVLMTLLVVIFAEVLPKTLALRNPDSIAFAIVRPMSWIVFIVRPISDLIQKLVKLFADRFQNEESESEKEQASEEALLGAIDLHSHEQSETNPSESLEARNMMRSILDLDDVTVGEIMTHRKNIELIDASLPVEEIVAHVLSSPFTRLPLWRDDQDNIVGVLHAKNLLRAIKESSQEDLNKINIEDIAKDAWFVPENTILLDQLTNFRNRKEHFALVVDEYGSLEGIVTLEDILEEIVGEISDEQDTDVEGVFPQANGSVVVEGTVTLRDLNRRFDWSLPDEEASTIAGLVLYESREIPKVGQVFDFYGFRIKILKRQRHQITSVSIRQLST